MIIVERTWKEPNPTFGEIVTTLHLLHILMI